MLVEGHDRAGSVPADQPPAPRRVVARAPGRIDLAGGGTDPEPYASDHGGAVLNLAIDHHAHVVVEARDDANVLLRSLDLGAAASAPLGEGFAAVGPLALVSAIVNRFPPQQGCEITTSTELPPGSGLSSSAALGVALIGALGRFRRRDLAPAEVADAHSDVERFDLGMWGGKQDPYASAFGGLRLWRFDGPRVREEPLDLPEAVRLELERDLVLVYSGQAHLSGDIHNDILADYRRGEGRVLRAQHRLKAAALGLRDALRAGDLERAASLLDENWAAHRELHESCSTPRLIELIAAGKTAGALGAKVCGAGGGGAVVFLAPAERHAALRAAVEALGARVLHFKIDPEGLRVASTDVP